MTWSGSSCAISAATRRAASPLGRRRRPPTRPSRRVDRRPRVVPAAAEGDRAGERRRARAGRIWRTTFATAGAGGRLWEALARSHADDVLAHLRRRARPVWTPAVLARSRARARARPSSCSAPRPRATPTPLRRALAEGHEVELHGDEHLRHGGHPASGSPTTERGARGARRARRAAAPLAHAVGRLAPWTAAVAAAHGLELAGWTADTHDWRGDRAEAMLAAVAPRPRRRRGGADARRPRPRRAARRLRRDRAADPAARRGRPRARGLEPGLLGGAGARRQPGARARMTALARAGVSRGTLAAIARPRPRWTPPPAFPRGGVRGARGRRRARRSPRASGTPAGPREWALVRAVARADGSVGRIFDGHLNARRAARRAGARAAALRRADRGRARAGCGWACGAPTRRRARASRRGWSAGAGGLVLEGDKVFCSGAGGIDRALVLARGARSRARRCSSTSTCRGREIDRTWYRAAGMRASESHRVGSAARACSRCSASRASWPASPGSRATRSAPPPPGRGSPTRPPRPRSAARRPRRARRPARARRPGASRPRGDDRPLARARGRARRRRARSADLRTLLGAAARGGRRRRPHDPRRGGARLRLAPVRDRAARSTAPAATSSCSCSSTASTRWCAPASAGRRCG